MTDSITENPQDTQGMQNAQEELYHAKRSKAASVISLPQDLLNDEKMCLQPVPAPRVAEAELSFIETLRKILLLPYDNPKNKENKPWLRTYQAKERLVLTAMLLFAVKQNAGGLVRITNLYLSQILGMARPKLMEALNNLKELGLITLMPKDSTRVYCYEINFDQIGVMYDKAVPMKNYVIRNVTLDFKVPVEKELDDKIEKLAKENEMSYNDSMMLLVAHAADELAELSKQMKENYTYPKL